MYLGFSQEKKKKKKKKKKKFLKIPQKFPGKGGDSKNFGSTKGGTPILKSFEVSVSFHTTNPDFCSLPIPELEVGSQLVVVVVLQAKRATFISGRWGSS